MAIQIKKRISLEFLGDDYRDGFIVVSSLPMDEYDSVMDEAERLQEADNKAALRFIQDMVNDHFISGEIPQDGKPVTLTVDTLGQLPADVFVEAFQQMTGRTSPNS